LLNVLLALVQFQPQLDEDEGVKRAPVADANFVLKKNVLCNDFVENKFKNAPNMQEKQQKCVLTHQD